MVAGVGVGANQSINLRNFRIAIAVATGIIDHANGGNLYSAAVTAVGGCGR